MMSKVTLKHTVVVYGVDRQASTTFKTVVKNGKDKTQKASPNKQSIMKYLTRLPQGTKRLRSCSGNLVKMLLKSHLGIIKCHSQYNKVIRFLQHNSATVNAGDLGCTAHDLETVIILVLHSFNFIPPRSHHSRNLTRSRRRYSTTVTLSPGEGTTASKVESSA